MKTRSEHISRNGKYGIINKVIVLFLSFLSRTIFINTLGAEYLGINGLYTNILSVLSLAELGVGNVLIYSLYRPIAENDNLKIARIMFLCKKIYRLISISILFIGIIIVPFLGYIVNADIANSEVTLYYLIFLLNSVVSYLAIYKSTLIRANQEQYIIDKISLIANIGVNLIQIVVLILYKNFIVYLGIMVMGTITQNIFITIIANKKYPFIKSNIIIENDEKKIIMDNIKSTFVYKLGQVIINYTDNILISIIIGTIYVGYYSNYSLIVTQVNSIISIIIGAMIASIGNLTTENNIEKSHNIFQELILLFHMLTAFCTICFIIIFNNFIVIWLGNENLLSQNVVIAIALSFYIQNIINPVWMYREAYGLFKEIKYVMIITASINIVLSIGLGLKYGLAGIIIATGIARILTTVWYEPIVLYKKIFKKSVLNYYFKQLRYCICSIMSYLIINIITLDLKPSFVNILIEIVISFITIIVVFFIFNFNNKEYKNCVNRINIKIRKA